MKNTAKLGLATLLVAVFAGTAAAQKSADGNAAPRATATDTATKEKPQSISLYRPAEINHIRPADQRGVNMFESPKEDAVPFTGFALSFGGAFTQEFQGLDHSNTATPVMVSGVN